MSHEVSEISFDLLVASVPELKDYNLCYIYNWQQVSSEFKYYQVQNKKSGKIQGAFCLFYSKRKGFTHVSNPPYFQNCGLWIESKLSNRYELNSLNKKVLTEVSSFMNGFKWVNVSLPVQVSDTQPFIWDGFNCIPRYTCLLGLDPAKNLEDDMSKGLKRDISRISETGITYESEISNKALEVLRQSSAAHRGAEEAAYWERLTTVMMGEKWFSTSVAKLGDNYGAASLVRVNDHALYLFGGSDKMEGVPLGTAALWKAISVSREQGIRWIDFEGSMIKGIERYFRSFGTELTAYYTIQKEPKIISTARMIKS